MLALNPYIDQVAQNIGNRMGEAYATGTRAGTFSAFSNDGNSPLGKSRSVRRSATTTARSRTCSARRCRTCTTAITRTERAAQDAAARGSTGLANFGVQNAGCSGSRARTRGNGRTRSPELSVLARPRSGSRRAARRTSKRRTTGWRAWRGDGRRHVQIHFRVTYGRLLGDYTPDPLAQGFARIWLGAADAAAMGGGIGPGMQCLRTRAQQAQLMRRQMAQDAMRQQYCVADCRERGADGWHGSSD